MATSYGTRHRSARDPDQVDHTSSIIKTHAASQPTKSAYLTSQLVGQGLVQGPLPGLVGVVPEPVAAVAVVVPAGEIDDRVQADSLDGHAPQDRGAGLAAHGLQPARSRISFD